MRRRQYLSGVVVAGVTAIAGCSGLVESQAESETQSGDGVEYEGAGVRLVGQTAEGRGVGGAVREPADRIKVVSLVDRA